MADGVRVFAAYMSLQQLISTTASLKNGSSKVYTPVLMTQFPSSLTLTQELASSNSKSCSNSTRLANSGSCFKLLFRLRMSQSGRGRAVEEPAIV